MDLPDHLADTALARLFLDPRIAPDVVAFSLPGGATLFEAGEAADYIYFLRAGRLAAIRQDEGMGSTFLGVIRPGEPAGEMAMIAKTPHSAKLVALRDSEILALPSAAFFRAADRDPAVMVELARLMILRARQTAAKAPVGDPTVFGFIGLGIDIDTREQVERIEHAIRRLGYTVTLVGREAQHAPTEWFSNVEAEHDFVLYVAESDESLWKTMVGRQVDRLFLMARGETRPKPAARASLPDPLLRQGLVDLILLQRPLCIRPEGSEGWLDALPVARLFHLRDHEQAHYSRIARTLTGMAVGLVLSGGGARAYAHIGAIKALRESKTPIDFVCGASMGAVIAAALAMGWNDAEIDWRIRKAFVDSSPLDDIAFPMIAMTRGDKVRVRLREHFADTQIADLWLPFFCVSSNLTLGAYHMHSRGNLARALRASISLPGILPPVSDGENVLVDGAVMKNLPADVLRNVHRGPIVAVDVSRARGLTTRDVATPPSLWRWFWSGEWRQGPPIVALLMRAGTVSTGRDLIASREASDVLVVPSLSGIDIRDWEAFDPAVTAGYLATVAALAKLTHPVTDLRRRPASTDYILA
jgi:NTE family protein